jgi:hypothetical protein
VLEIGGWRCVSSRRRRLGVTAVVGAVGVVAVLTGGCGGDVKTDGAGNTRPSGAASQRQDAAKPEPSPGKGDETGKRSSRPARNKVALTRAFLRRSKRGSRKVGPHECLPSMSRPECAAAARAIEQSRDGSRVIGPHDCPPSLTRTECREAAKAIENSSR